MFKALNRLIENNISASNLDFYTVIIGKKPSQGARSPKLWNKVYDYEGKKIQMIPICWQSHLKFQLNLKI